MAPRGATLLRLPRHLLLVDVIVVVVLAVLAPAASHAGAGERPLLDALNEVASGGLFECDNGRAVDVMRRCDLSPDCADGSDESAAACSAPNATLAAGDKVAVRVQLKREHGAVWLSLCGARACSTLSLSGVEPGGGLAYMAYTGCNVVGDHCTTLYWEQVSRLAVDFPSGGLVLEVERRRSEMVVWLQGRPEHAAHVPAGHDATLLRVRPLFWMHDMVVKFSDLALLSRTVPLWCERNMLNVDMQCYCANGCPDPTCDAPKTVLSAGDRSTVRVQYRDDQWAVWFLLCDDCVCSRLAVSGVSADGELAHWPATRCNNLGDHCMEPGREVRPQGPEVFFSSGELVFEVEKSEWQLAVWLRGHPERKATVPASARSVTLKVRPMHWTSKMPVKFVDSVDLPGRHLFLCDNGRTVSGMTKCDGVPDCADGSDEALSRCEVAASTLAPGDRRSVRVHFEEAQLGVWFVVCDVNQCRTMSVSGVRLDGSLHHLVYAGCNQMGDHCTTLVHMLGHPSSPLPEGEVAFEVERTSGEVSVWRRGRPERRARMAVPASSILLLKVRPLLWKGVVRVQISEPVLSVSVGEEVTVRVLYEARQGGVWFLLCDNSRCDILSVFGCTREGDLGYEAWLGCNEEGSDCASRDLPRMPDGMQPLPSGLHTFRVERRVAEVAVWLKGYHRRAALLPVNGRANILRVRPQLWDRQSGLEEIRFER